MRIESATVENHRFGTARRRGYDPAEVDAVMSRVADTLAQYERMIKRLEQRLENPAMSPDDMKSVVAAQESRNKLLSDAKTAAAQIIDAATEEATAIRNEASVTADRIIGAADDHLSAAQMDAQRIRDEAETLIDLAKERSDELRAQADGILTSAIEEAEKVREESAAAAVTQATEAEKMLHLAQAEANRLAADSERLAEKARAEVDLEIADVLAHARQQAEAMINSAIEETRLIRDRLRVELEEMRSAKATQANEQLTTARNEAAEIRASAAATAEAIAAQGRANAEELLAQARTTALERLTTAQEEAEDVLSQASREADVIVAVAREDNRRLERRIKQLRTAVSEFEAHIENLAQVAGDRAGLIKDMIGQESSAARTDRTTEGTASGGSGAPAIAPRKKGEAYPARNPGRLAAGLVAEYAEPDGSGQPPAGRPTVPAQSNPWDSAADPATGQTELDLVDEPFFYVGGETDSRPADLREDESTEDAPGSAIGSAEDTDSDSGTTSTIYQRRGSGIKRRVAAIHVSEAEETP